MKGTRGLEGSRRCSSRHRRQTLLATASSTSASGRIEDLPPRPTAEFSIQESREASTKVITGKPRKPSEGWRPEADADLKSSEDGSDPSPDPSGDRNGKSSARSGSKGPATASLLFSFPLPYKDQDKRV